MKKKKLSKEELEIFEATAKKYHKATTSVVMRVLKKELQYTQIQSFDAIQIALDTGIVEEDGGWLKWLEVKQ